MLKKSIKGYLILAISLGVIIEACGEKEVPVTPPAPLEKTITEPIDQDNLAAELGLDLGDDFGGDFGGGEEAPVFEEAPIEEAPIEETPVEETPVEETPVEETPVEEIPAEETPTADPTPEPEPEATPTPEPTEPPEPVCSVIVSGNLSATIGKTEQLSAKFECDDGTNDESNITWESETTSVATVSDTGLITTIGDGETKITAKHTDSDSNETISEKLFTVTKECSIAISGQNEVFTGSSIQLEGKVQCNDGKTYTNISWSSSNTNVAFVGNGGLVESKSEGVVTINASYQTDATVKTTHDVNVKKAPSVYGNDLLLSITSDGTNGDLDRKSALNAPAGIDVRNGQIYVSYSDTRNTDEGAIKIYNTNGNVVNTIWGATFSALPLNLTGIVSDGSRVWTVNRVPYAQSKRNIYSFSNVGESEGRQSSSLGLYTGSGTDFRDMAIYPSESVLYIADGTLKSIIKVNYTANGIDPVTEQKLFISNVSPVGVAVDSNGNVFVSTSAGFVSKYNNKGEKLLEFNTKGKNSAGPTASVVRDVAIDKRGYIYLLAGFEGTNLIFRYDLDGNYQRRFGLEAGIIDPSGIAVNPNDGTIYVSDKSKNLIHQFAPGKGN